MRRLNACSNISRCSRQNFNSKAIIDIPKADIYSFGRFSEPVFRNLQWTVKEGESWAIISSASTGKASLFQTLLGHLRISPYPPQGPLPFLQSREAHNCLSFVSFRNRQTVSGAFYDYTARYGAVHEEDRITLRQNMFPETIQLANLPAEVQEIMRERLKNEPKEAPKVNLMLFEEFVDKMGLRPFLDLPLIALSNGQTRRARILKAILSKPELLLLDEPLTGLDVEQVPKLLDVLHSLHMCRAPRVIIGLRKHDPIPEWITHLASISRDRVTTGEKDEILKKTRPAESKQLDPGPSNKALTYGSVLVDLQNVSIRYHERTVLKNINWKIRRGERWHLCGANGSGKTTLLSLLTGDHPQSYTQSHLYLFGKPRARTPTPKLASLVGLLSPEIFDVFPRRSGMSVRDVVGTGFDGIFTVSRLGVDGMGVQLSQFDIQWRAKRIETVLDGLWWKNPDLLKDFGSSDFVDLSMGEQRMVLLMRALVGQKPLVLLDEVWSGMDEDMIDASREYLRGKGLARDQAVVVITHLEGEVPWGTADGLKKFQL